MRKQNKMIWAILALIIVGVLAGYIFRLSWYRFLPSQNDAGYEIDDEGRMSSLETQEPYNGRLKTNYDTERVEIYTYKEGHLDGPNVAYNNGRIVESGYWKDGLQNGRFQLYTSEGILIDDALFEDGERHGLTKQYYPDSGTLKVEATYVEGELEGVVREYHPNGKLLREGVCLKGVRNGLSEQYYPNGVKEIVMSYKNDVPDGPYQRFNDEGVLITEGTFKDGVFYGKDLNPSQEDEATGEDHMSDDGTISIRDYNEDEDGISDENEGIISNMLVDGKLKVTIKGADFSFPCPVSELIKAGWRFPDTIKENDKFSEKSKDTPMTQPDGSIIFVSLQNPSKKPLLYNKANVISVFVWMNQDQTSLIPTQLPGGIVSGQSTKLDVLDIYGEPAMQQESISDIEEFKEFSFVNYLYYLNEKRDDDDSFIIIIGTQGGKYDSIVQGFQFSNFSDKVKIFYNRNEY